MEEISARDIVAALLHSEHAERAMIIYRRRCDEDALKVDQIITSSCAYAAHTKFHTALTWAEVEYGFELISACADLLVAQEKAPPTLPSVPLSAFDLDMLIEVLFFYEELILAVQQECSIT
jgi:hypothetical protein